MYVIDYPIVFSSFASARSCKPCTTALKYVNDIAEKFKMEV
ncbi:hypothetical protein [Candidatus Nitrosocosmicus sp. T]